ncbi:MAG: PorT family protein [Hymenobacteraceae bacterium]|nr:PorT family protein [Hymenobacteraceae bacterium]MDX5397337.1 PorT family protein [Hymenobacteraceae bacterium]MDX5513416.1 PorT family protein [Hymenobacteraceae bacterium]
MKQLFIVAVLALAGFGATAQTVGFGIKGGANYAGIVGDEISENDLYNRKLGLHGGGVFDFGFNQSVSLKAEVLYSSKGFEYDDIVQQGPGYTYTLEGKETFHTVDVPLLLNVKAGPLFFEVGPMFSFLARRDREVKETQELAFGTLNTVDRSSTETTGFNFFEYGFSAGLGYSFESRFNFGARYNATLSRIQEKDQSNYPFPENARHSVFQLSVGYMFANE